MYRIRYAFLMVPLVLMGCSVAAPPTGPRLTQEMVDAYLAFQSDWDVMSANERQDACSAFAVSLSSNYSYVQRSFLNDVC
jgi:hypothetical protein